MKDDAAEIGQRNADSEGTNQANKHRLPSFTSSLQCKRVDDRHDERDLKQRVETKCGNADGVNLLVLMHLLIDR